MGGKKGQQFAKLERSQKFDLRVVLQRLCK
jgi:hypothetical protein